MKKVAILQSNYIPWKGYFDLIAAVDEFILYDDMQFTKNDWRNRNLIKTPSGPQWLTVPVGQDIRRRIRDVAIPNSLWQRKHWAALQLNYGRTAHFKEIAAWLEPVYLGQTHVNLSALNRQLIVAICGYLGINTTIRNSWEFDLVEGRTERLVAICQQAGATEYLSGPAARAYMDEDMMRRAGIALSWFDYGGYPAYPQAWGEFNHNVSILDLLFNCGKDAVRYMRFVKV